MGNLILGNNFFKFYESHCDLQKLDNYKYHVHVAFELQLIASADGIEY